MPRSLLYAVLALVASGCGRGGLDPAEITRVFARHSYAQCDLARLEEALRRPGQPDLTAFDANALFSPQGWRPAPGAVEPPKAGTGMVLWKMATGAVVVKVFAGSPAEAAGIKAGDRIDLIDDTPVAAMTADAVRAALAGDTGGICQVAGKKPSGVEFKAALGRDFGAVPVVWGFNIPGTRAGYLRVFNFSGKTSDSVRAELDSLLDGGAQRVIIDLRGNYGGSLDELARTLALFAPRAGKVFSAVSRHAGYSKVFLADGSGPYSGVKTLLLADAGTVSRAEVFAATLREWGGAVLVGGATGGNVSATRSFQLANGAALRITVAHLLTPSGEDLDGKGLVPDVPVQGGAQREKKFLPLPDPLASADEVLIKALAAN